MADIELLLLPQHAVRQRLQQMNEAAGQRRADTNAWLLEYLKEKYHFSVYEADAELPLLESLAVDNK